jgi:hypothetical protein
MRKVNVYDPNETKVEQFRTRWKEQKGEEISFDRAVNIMIENIVEIEEVRTLTVTLKDEIPPKKPRKPLKHTSKFVMDFRL